MMPGKCIGSGGSVERTGASTEAAAGISRPTPCHHHNHIEFQSQPQEIEGGTAAAPEGEGKAVRA